LTYLMPVIVSGAEPFSTQSTIRIRLYCTITNQLMILNCGLLNMGGLIFYLHVMLGIKGGGACSRLSNLPCKFISVLV